MQRITALCVNGTANQTSSRPVIPSLRGICGKRPLPADSSQARSDSHWEDLAHRGRLILKAATCLITLALVGAPSIAARPFPETRSRIRVYADMLPTQMTDAQWRFAAAHYAGSQKQTVTWVRRMRKLAPDFLMLHYQLAVGTGPAKFVVGDQWTNDFDSVSKHEDWFLHDASGHRIHQKAWDWYVMDIAFNGDRPKTGFPAYWTRTAIERMRTNEDDGTFADSYTQDILMNQVVPFPPVFHDPDVTKRDWLPNLNRFGAFCAEAFHRQPEHFYYLPNLGGQVTTWDKETDLSVGDGGMIEGFAASAPGRYYSDDDWKLEMTRVLGLAEKGKIVIAQTSVDPANVDHRWFVVGSYLLTKGSRSYINMIEKSSLEWYPEYDLDLGAYTEPPATDVQAYWRPDWGVYRRDYEKGIILVNPTGAPVTIADLGREYKVVSATGGGPVGEDGRATGSLSMEPVRRLTIPAHSARVLLTP